MLSFFFSRQKAWKKIYAQLRHHHNNNNKKPIQLRSSNRLIYEFFFLKKKCSYKDKTIHPLSLLYLALYIKLQVPTIYLQTSSVTLFSLFASAWLYIKWYGHKTCYIYIYLQWWTKVWYVLYYYYYYYLCYISLLFFCFFYPKVIVFLWLSSSTLICSKHTTTN